MNKKLNIFKIQYLFSIAFSTNFLISATVLKYKDLITENLIPMEIKITKSKDDGKDSCDMWLFCKQNLRIYDDIIDYINDIPELVTKTNDLKNEIVTITCSALAAINDDYCNVNDNIQFDFDLT